VIIASKETPSVTLTTKTQSSLQVQEVRVDNQWFLSFALLDANETVLPLSEWTGQNHEGASWLIDLANESPETEGVINKNNNSVQFSMYYLMTLFEGQENYLHRILELPRLFEGGLEIKGHGLLHSNSFRLTYNWLSGTRPVQAERRGAILLVGNRRFWLPNHAYQMANHLDDLKEALDKENQFSERLTQLAEFQRLLSMLPSEEQRRIRQSSDLASLKLYYADSFRLEAVPDDESFTIRPILLRQRLENDNNDSRVFENVLPPAEQERYAKYFSDSTTLLPHYSIGVGKYLILSDKLNRTLEYVHRIQHANASARSAFLKNPKAAFSAYLDGMLDEDELNNVFSDRVIGIGEWQSKVIPWIQMRPQEWLPNGKLPEAKRGICIDNEKISLSTQGAKELIKKVQSAISQGNPTVTHSGHTVPATSDTLGAIGEVFRDIPIKPDNYQSPSSPKRQPATPRPVMLVKENLDTLEFFVPRTNRSNIPSNTGLPDRLRTNPKPHQIEAYHWLCDHYRTGSRGLLLADDMGLGKTYQSLMFLSWLREGMENAEITEKPLLIVAPTGLLKNWEAEIERHLTNDLGQLVRVYGSDLRALQTGSNLNTTRLNRAGLVLTTYETLTRYQTSFNTVTFAAVVFDETQKLKNPGTQNYGAASGVNADFWIGMTGTPIENRLADLWSITDVLQPGMLGTIKEFSNKYEKAILDGKESAQQRMLDLQEGLIHPTSGPAFMLRRLKHEQLPGLPEKHLKVHKEFMLSEQAAIYKNIIESVTSNTEKQRGAMLQALQKLRACSLHPDYKRENKQWRDSDFINASARLRACFSILDEIHKRQEKALIFIEYNDWHRPDFLPAILRRRYSLDSLPLVINGQIGTSARQKRVDAFQQETGKFDVMLISPKAGGVGLTLTAANHVIHLTRWWNPAVEDQATDRIYRIGQHRPVFIHYPLAIHPDLPEQCFDVLLHNVLENKRKLRDKTLIALPETDDIADELIQKGLNVGSSTSWTLADSYLFSGTQFEEHVLHKLAKLGSSFGYRVRSTPASWDGGADMIIETIEGLITAVVQCKHVSTSSKAPEISADLERATTSYSCAGNVWKIGITNASKLSSNDQQWMSAAGHRLIISGQQGMTPEVIFKHL
jgi:hypothetical protein